MNDRFSLSSEQCELLLAFEGADSLNDLARKMGRDASVVSRQLKQLADLAPVLVKEKGRWELSDLGRQINQWSRSALSVQSKLLSQENQRLSQKRVPSLRERPCLILVGVQKGFDDPCWGARSRHEAEGRIGELLKFWRSRNLPVVHLKHGSEEPNSSLRKGSVGSEFKKGLEPLAAEMIFQKSRNSGFADTELKAFLEKEKIQTVVLVGFSLNHCVDATARSASDFGFVVYLVADATVTFERIGPDGQRLSAHALESAILANLNQEFAAVIQSAELLRGIESAHSESPAETW